MEKSKVKKGQRFWSDMSGDMYLKVMAVEDNYVMARFKGCMPFIESLGMFTARFASYFYTEKPTHD